MMGEGFRLYTFPWLFNDDWERSERAAMARLIPMHDILIDIGANHGFYAALADHLGRPSLAFEPDDANLAVLKRNSIGRRIEVAPLAVSDQDRDLTLFGRADTASTIRNWEGVAAGSRQTVKAVTLDAFLKDRFEGKRILFKVDVEGAEDRVLIGAAQTLNRPSTWMIEGVLKAPSGEASGAIERVFAIMEAAGFRAKNPEGDFTDIEAAKRSLQSNVIVQNFIFEKEPVLL